MRRSVLAAVSAAAALAFSSVALATSAGAAPPPQPGQSHRNTHVCGTPAPGTASCNAIRHDTVDSNGKPAPAPTGPTKGYLAKDLRAAYDLTGVGGTGGTIAIVDAYDHPNALHDLNVYRAAMGIPECLAGCFTKVNQNGSTSTRSLPRADGGWAQEISLDLDMASAACPGCKILLVEAKSASFSDLSAAVTYAASQEPKAISNSYGGAEVGTASFAGAYNRPGIAVTASTGDSGYGAQVPAAFPGVVAVGGTSLTNTSGVWSEKAWSGAGSGCSAYHEKPTYQTAVTMCANKAVADVAAVADPDTGVAVYDSYAYQGAVGWMVFGGTSASAPFIAGLYAQADDFGSSAGEFTWTNSGELRDVTEGSNGTCPADPSLWCTSGAGWDGPTGLGTPNGLGAF